MLDNETLARVFEDFSKKKILVIGDVMIDSYLWGKVERISPEAPVPIVAVNKRENRLGGAANVARNIKALGAMPIMCSVIGNDLKANEFIELCQQEGLPTEGLYKSNDRITTTKFRIIGNNAHLLRVDEEYTADITVSESNALFDIISGLIDKYQIDALIFQDYNKGVLVSGIIQKVIKLANDNSIPSIVDPKKKNFESFQNVTLFKPNLKELKEGLNREINHENSTELEAAVGLLHKDQNIQILLTTLSDAGVFISQRKSENNFESCLLPAHKRSIADVSGAGDTVVSVASLCLVCGMEIRDIAAISNLAGGIVCEEVGVAPVNKARLFEEATKLII